MLDRQFYQPWFFYYPAGTNLAQLSEFFYRIFLSGKVIPLRGMPMVVIAHSMGGLVVRDALNRYDGTGGGPSSVRLVTIASPLGGMASAAAAKFGAMIVPSWRDLVPHSGFLGHLHRKPLRSVRGRESVAQVSGGGTLSVRGRGSQHL
jgi:pimeloyl-ACP methyl ester carboxylesterase